jgi:VIT1/CCC1 family predicted Fe2+/Mn2+ transporter
MTQETKKPRKRLSPDEITARVRALLVLTLAGVLAFIVGGLLYSLIFVYQPDKMAEADIKMFEILSPLTAGITGALTGLAAGAALSGKSNNDDE